MKKTAVLVYNGFCNFEISVALEILALEGKPITVFAKDKSIVKSEEGICVVPDKTIGELNIDEYDSLLLPGAVDIRDAIEDDEMLSFIKVFGKTNKIIGAISIAPVLLVKCGLLRQRAFMAGVNKEELFEEGFSAEELSNMHGWDDNLKNPISDGYIKCDNIITSVSYNFVKFGLAFGKMLNISIPEETFGISSKKNS